MRTTLPWIPALALALLGASVSPQAGLAQSNGPVLVTEHSIKAAFLYKFAAYVEWPPDAQQDALTPFIIGVMESQLIADELAKITVGRTINERSISVRQVNAEDTFSDLDILFIGEHDRKRLKELLLPARQLPVLTVTETDGAMAEGSIINFTTEKQRVRFEISLPAAEQSRLKLSSRLLAVAERVHRVPE